MPEIVEVELLKNKLNLLKNSIFKVQYSDSSRFDATLGDDLVVNLFRRKGKFILGDLNSGMLLVLHLGMSGSVLVEPPPEMSSSKHVRSAFTLGEVPLILIDPRGFGRFTCIKEDSLSDYSYTLNNLGHDVLDPSFSKESAVQLLLKSLKGKPIKQVLLEQRVLAGVGNYIADESLYLSGIHPLSTKLSEEKSADLVEAVVKVVSTSLQAQGLSIKDYKLSDGSSGSFESHLKVYSRKKMPCHTCGLPLKALKIYGRTSTFCAECQKIY